MKKAFKMLLIFFVISGQLIAQSTSSKRDKKSKNMNQTERTEHYTFELSDKVIRQKVTFKNRYGIVISGDLYTPKETKTEKLEAIAISGPFGAVKEQSSGLYANQLAEKGFITLAFDPSYTGESGGEPRNISSSDISTEDFSAAVDFLGLQKNIDRTKIGIIGICGLGGFALNATAIDKRIKAVVTTSMYDIPRVSSKGYYDKITLEERAKILEQMGQQRWTDAERGQLTYGENELGKTNESSPQFVKEYYDYYKTPRGFHERSINSNAVWAKTNGFSLMNMPILNYLKEVSPRPILIIAGENAHSRYFSEDIYKMAAEPKELMIIPNTVHVDLYDRIDKIPFDKIEEFFHINLK